MTPFTGRAIGLGFAALWLWLGATALPTPWNWAIGVAGALAIGALAWSAWRMIEPRDGLFQMRRYWIAVVGEVVVLIAVQLLLHRFGLWAYLIPVVGVIVGLHFIGLWWAGGGVGYVGLAVVMTAVNAAAMLLPPGGAAMQAVAGLGSAAALAWFAGTGARA